MTRHGEQHDTSGHLDGRLSLVECVSLACLLEVLPPKVGNVHRGADFPDLTLTDLAAAGIVSAAALADAGHRGVGRAVLDAVAATKRHVGTNANLGIALLIAPLAAVPRTVPLDAGIADVLAALTPSDAADVYEAIRLAQPGGLGTSEAYDVAGPPPDDLLAAMAVAADRDLIAKQYDTRFADVLGVGVPHLKTLLDQGVPLTLAVIDLHLLLLATHGDSLIGRKLGAEASDQVRQLATRVRAAGPVGSEAYHRAASDVDFWMRSDGNRRNPGATADLVAATLFVGLRDGWLTGPWR